VFAARRLHSKTETILDEKAMPLTVLESDNVSDFQSGVEVRK
jgi:hypothetical protein